MFACVKLLLIMSVIYTNSTLNTRLAPLRSQNKTIGFIPTMGALHEGHLSLVRKALHENDILVVSIFVNPTQFNNSADLKTYPRTLNDDIALLQTVSKNIIVYAPSVEDIYGNNTVSETFNFGSIETVMEGQFRPGHFNGVGTVVKRLFEIVKPNNAYFGEKDFQQLAIINKLVKLCNLPVNIVGCKIHRAASGLAMSSRNKRLKPEYLKAAPFIYKTLQEAKEKFGTKSAKQITEWAEKQFKQNKYLKLEYFIIADIVNLQPVKRKSRKKNYRAFIAAYADDVRLIDNIALN